MLYRTNKNCCKYWDKLKCYVGVQKIGRDILDISFTVSAQSISMKQGCKLIPGMNFSRNKSLLPCHRENVFLLWSLNHPASAGGVVNRYWTFPFFPRHFLFQTPTGMGRREGGKDSVPQMCDRHSAAPRLPGFYSVWAKAAVEIV